MIENVLYFKKFKLVKIINGKKSKNLTLALKKRKYHVPI